MPDNHLEEDVPTGYETRSAFAVLEDLNSYLAQGIHQVQGWCDPHLWQIVWPLRAMINEGSVAEIGVFEGKFLIGLSKTFGVSPERKATAIDVFDMQEFNLDKAGRGKKDVLAANMRKFGFKESEFVCIEVDSLSLRQAEAEAYVREHGRVAFFSVDGCHEVVHTVCDVEFAMQVTRHDGIIAVDDYTNAQWPSVQEAIARMYILRDFSFVPLAVGCNKLFLCSYSYHAKYLTAVHAYVAANHPDTRIKSVKRFGFGTLTVSPNLQQWTPLKAV